MNGKATCAILKQIRRDIAEKNDIALTIAECTHQGDCPGTCPRCEAEVRILEKALAEKKRKGLKTAVAGISAGLLTVGLSSCTPADKVGAESLFTRITDKLRGSNPIVEELDGDIMPPDWSPDREEDGVETMTAPTIEGELVDPDYEGGNEEEYELAGDVPAENLEEDMDVFDPEDFPPLAGIMPMEDLEPVTADPAEDDAP